MKFSLSTNWCNRRCESGEEIVDQALALGFSEIELGFHTTAFQVAGFRRRLDEMPVGSVHAFCPVPISAPCGYPELYHLASFDENEYRVALVHVRRNIEFAADIGADTLVLHAGRVSCAAWLPWRHEGNRRRRGAKLVAAFKPVLAQLADDLERRGVTLALENLPYPEGFPDETEIEALAGGRVRPWFDTGHDFVRARNGWKRAVENPSAPVGMHLSDSRGNDDHLAPGEGRVDFAALKPLALAARHLVFEPNPAVSAESIKKGISHLMRLWSDPAARS